MTGLPIGPEPDKALSDSLKRAFDDHYSDGVALNSIAHPRGSWWNRFLVWSGIAKIRKSSMVLEYVDIYVPKRDPDAEAIASQYKIVSESSEIIR